MEAGAGGARRLHASDGGGLRGRGYGKRRVLAGRRFRLDGNPDLYLRCSVGDNNDADARQSNGIPADAGAHHHGGAAAQRRADDGYRHLVQHLVR